MRARGWSQAAWGHYCAGIAAAAVLLTAAPLPAPAYPLAAGALAGWVWWATHPWARTHLR